ncbi:MAG: hypothetical protein LAN62_10120 [Acidobacteriia bacterium]|nr:hypothetical protein [Terriglobia bacterium]
MTDSEERLKALFHAALEESNRNVHLANRLETTLTSVISQVRGAKGVTEDSVEFHDLDRRLGVNTLPLSMMMALPRIGEKVSLPGGPHGPAEYRVADVIHFYVEDLDAEGPSPVRLFKVTVGLRATARRAGRRPAGVVDPFTIYTEGESALRRKLEELDLDRLKDIIAEHGMDSSKLAMKWKSRERLVQLIVKTVHERAQKGDAFRSN